MFRKINLVNASLTIIVSSVRELAGCYSYYSLNLGPHSVFVVSEVEATIPKGGGGGATKLYFYVLLNAQCPEIV